MKKKVLIIGNSATAYALGKKLSVNNDIYIAPGNDLMKEFAVCLDIRENSVMELLEFVLENDIDLTIPVSKTTIDTNIVEIFSQNNQQIFAPDFNASQIAIDKAFAKKLLYKLHIPTPKFGIFEKQSMAQDYIRNLRVPFVIKTNENSSATVLSSSQEAKYILDTYFSTKNQKVIIEDYIWGSPFSFYVITDGYKALPFGSSIVYKHSLEGDGGQLTTGMGAVSPNYKLSFDNENYLMNEVIYPTLNYLEQFGNAYLGILGLNGILTDNGNLTILGYQTFMQDCDTTAILSNIDEDLIKLFEACIVGSFSDEIDEIKFCDMSATSIVLRCNNHDNNQNIIKNLDNLDDETCIDFYPNVNKNRYLEYEAQHGSNLIITSSASTVAKSTEKAYNQVEIVDFQGKAYRKDICSINRNYASF